MVHFKKDKEMRSIRQSKLKALFFKTDAGNEPVGEWLTQLSTADKKQIGIDIQKVQFGWPLGMPLVSSLGNKLWEVRTTLNQNRIARIIFFMASDTMILLNGFIKKTQRTPKPEIDLALKRMQAYKYGEKND